MKFVKNRIMKRGTLLTFCLLLCAILFSGDLYGQFTVEESSNAKSITTKPQVKVTPRYDIDATNEALLKKQRRDEFNRKHYLEFNSGLVLNQTSFSNWASGGDNSFNGRASLYARHVYKERNVTNDTYINAAYGLGENTGKLWKTEDRIEINNALGYKMVNKWDYSMNVNFLSQFANGFASVTDSLPISKFLAPATINVALGFSYTKDNKCKIQLMPISGNLVVVNDQRLSDLGLYGVTPGEKIKSNVGAYVNVIWETPLVKDLLTYRTLASSFYDYKTTPNLKWQSWFSMKVVKYLSIELYCNVIFDDKVITPNGGFWQLNETLGLGVSYSFKNRDKL